MLHDQQQRPLASRVFTTMYIVNLAFSFPPILMNAASSSAITIDIDGSLFLQMGMFLILFLAIKPLVLDPFLKVVEERENRTDGARKQAREMDMKAGELGKDYAKQLDKVRQVASEERERLRSEAQKLEADIFSKAHEEAAGITREGKMTLEKQANEVREELTRQSSQLSQQIVTKVLGREVSS